MQGYDPNLLSRYIGLSKKPHQALSILVIPIHEKMASGPWTNLSVLYDSVYGSFQPVLHDCGMVHIKEPLLIGKSSQCGSSRFPLSLSKWSFTICLTPYNHK